MIVAREPIYPGCLSAGEVDAQIELLKDDLDAVAVRMKKALSRQKKSLFGDS